jgi:dTDP-4-dehydrorhamnose reductase
LKLLVLGAGGMAGHTVALHFLEQGYDVTAYSRRPFPFCKNITGDVEDSRELRRFLTSGNYDAVINCIGVLNRDAEEKKAAAVYLNSYLPHLLAETLRDTPARLIHISTDCVFSGKLGSYRENSPKDGESFYARSKALGEVEDGRNLTIRTSLVGPDINLDGIGLFNWFMKQSDTVHGYTNALWTGVTTLTLAKAIEQAVRENLTGIYHLVNGENISKFDLLCLFNRSMRNNSLTVLPDDGVRVDKSLVNSRTDFSFKVPSYESMVQEMREWIEQHRALYPHYFSGESYE